MGLAQLLHQGGGHLRIFQRDIMATGGGGQLLERVVCTTTPFGPDQGDNVNSDALGLGGDNYGVNRGQPHPGAKEQDDFVQASWARGLGKLIKKRSQRRGAEGCLGDLRRPVADNTVED